MHNLNLTVLNLYRLLYLNSLQPPIGTIDALIEPIQIVVFKFDRACFLCLFVMIEPIQIVVFKFKLFFAIVDHIFN